MARDEKNIFDTFTHYVQAFQTLNPRTVLSYCAVPCMGVVVMTNPMEIETLLGRMMENFKARGYGWSELTDLQVNQMSETLAFVSVCRVRYKADATKLERLGETYTFRKSDGAWKIIAAATHDSESILYKRP